MSWVQATLLARGLCRAWGGICGVALTGISIPQVTRQLPRGLHCSAATHSSETSLVPTPTEPQQRHTKAIVPYENMFGQGPNGKQDKASFLQAVQKFGEHSVRKRGHVDFIYLALRKMREYGVERDLAVYNQLLDIFPKEVFRPRNFIQHIFIHYPRQQQCGVAVLEQMENHGEDRRPALLAFAQHRGDAQQGDRVPVDSDIWTQKPPHAQVPAPEAVVPSIHEHQPLPCAPGPVAGPCGPGHIRPAAHRA
ncbi:hypothetical protein P7K49_033305 [Saguinus oedipus]|uniref:ECSIT N-terminal domain-containing protein n=1 Tax=Saguinus oedipus TaxID=9490 RepID=A0ABQ9TSM4_SAGOE|nr:hypothetical protein P7K49_033305 [Saguinus oedipus]